ncbi:TIGR01777 family oxidoreductase [Teredinibacter haidensis]|uniref:TIGR01777 family oxidoreductase n=1 Tax=Teredinibacter haidensis TaxID=2731755 RepID=UPI000948AB39|nr:TIGR01777 family oxidoreductase [Teredinibacter haidensis]
MASTVVFINGGTGFIGRALCSALLKLSCHQSPFGNNPSFTETPAQQHYQLYVQTRMPSHHRHRQITFLSSYRDLPDGCVPNIVVNLAGAPIAEKRWTQRQKKVLLDSRIRLTENLLKAVKSKGHKPNVLLNASAIGYYGVRGEEVLTEISDKGEGFASELCDQWESSAERFSALGSRICIFRIGVVLGPGGGAVSKLLPIFNMALGGPIAGGQQWFSWIHICDLVRMFIAAMHDPSFRGVFNATAPNPVRQIDFARALGGALNRPTFLPTPALALKLLYGQMADELLIGGQHVLPVCAQKIGFPFQHPLLPSALADVTQR